LLLKVNNTKGRQFYVSSVSLSDISQSIEELPLD
jgi:hypothetical protein